MLVSLIFAVCLYLAGFVVADYRAWLRSGVL